MKDEIRKAWPWIIVGNVFGEGHADLFFVDFEKG
jgi:hypothetical protein